MKNPAVLATSLLVLAAVVSVDGAEGEKPGPRFRPVTRVSIAEGFWEINGKATYPGTYVEGLLVNVRMANAVFDDLNPKSRPAGLDAEANTTRFIASIPSYRGAGVSAFTVSLQGGDPGYEDALCSAFRPDGSLRGAFMARTARVVEACDRAGMIVVLVLFHHLQDQVLQGEPAVRRGVQNVAHWVMGRGYTNVLLELADEYTAKGYDHEIFRSADRMAELVTLTKKAAPGLLVSSNRQGTGRIDPPVGNASDFLSTHFTGLPVEMIPLRVLRVMVYSKPVLCTADVRPEGDAAAALTAAVNALCSYGFALPRNERYPYEYGGVKDAPGFYGKVAELTLSGAGGQARSAPVGQSPCGME